MKTLGSAIVMAVALLTAATTLSACGSSAPAKSSISTTSLVPGERHYAPQQRGVYRRGYDYGVLFGSHRPYQRRAAQICVQQAEAVYPTQVTFQGSRRTALDRSDFINGCLQRYREY